MSTTGGATDRGSNGLFRVVSLDLKAHPARGAIWRAGVETFGTFLLAPWPHLEPGHASPTRTLCLRCRYVQQLSMFARRSLSLLRKAPLAPIRSLHASRVVRAVSKEEGGRVAESPAFKKISRNNVHVLDSATLNTWLEIPKGGMHGTNRKAAIWSIWYNHAVVPLYAVSVIAAGLCSWFMYR